MRNWMEDGEPDGRTLTLLSRRVAATPATHQQRIADRLAPTTPGSWVATSPIPLRWNFGLSPVQLAIESRRMTRSLINKHGYPTPHGTNHWQRIFGFLPWPPSSPRHLGTLRHHHMPPRRQLLSRSQRDRAVQLLSLPAQSHAWLHLPRQAHHHIDHHVGWEAGPPASPNRACSPHLSSAAASRSVSASENTARRWRPRTRLPTTRPRASTAARNKTQPVPIPP